MIKKRIVPLLIGIYFAITPGKAQSYTVESFDGNKARINLFYKPASGVLSISYLQDTLMINDYMSVENVKVLNKIFLQINYVKRAGTNEDFMNQLLLYVHNGKLCQALHVNSLTTHDMRNISHAKNQPNEYSLFKLRVTLIGHNEGSYKLTLRIHNEDSSDRNPKSNFNYDKTAFLTFDKKSKVFYSDYEHMSGNHTFHNLNDKGGVKEYLEDDFPVVKIEKNKYYYRKGNWYTKDKNDFYSMLL